MCRGVEFVMCVVVLMYGDECSGVELLMCVKLQQACFQGVACLTCH